MSSRSTVAVSAHIHFARLWRRDGTAGNLSREQLRVMGYSRALYELVEVQQPVRGTSRGREQRAARGQQASASLVLLLFTARHLNSLFWSLSADWTRTGPPIAPSAATLVDRRAMAGSPLVDGVFSEYETDLATLTTSISSKLNNDAREQRGGELVALMEWRPCSRAECAFLGAEARRTLLRRVEMELEEADEIVSAFARPQRC